MLAARFPKSFDPMPSLGDKGAIARGGDDLQKA
jgi:hypothetical protein